jgi:hypothetical protein
MPADADADHGGDVVHDLQPEHQVALGVSPTGRPTLETHTVGQAQVASIRHTP